MEVLKEIKEISREKFIELKRNFQSMKDDNSNIFILSDKYPSNKRFYNNMLEQMNVYKITHFKQQSCTEAFTIFYGESKAILFDGHLNIGFFGGGSNDFVNLLEYIGIKAMGPIICNEDDSMINGERMEFNLLINRNGYRYT